MAVKYLRVNEQNYILAYITAMNGLGKLTPMEMRVLAGFIRHGGVTTETRQLVARELGLKSVSNVNNYVKDLKGKQALLEEGDKYVINHHYMPDREGVNIRFVWDESLISTSAEASTK